MVLSSHSTKALCFQLLSMSQPSSPDASQSGRPVLINSSLIFSSTAADNFAFTVG
ncbi:hypothetical protein INR49_012746 [Caranx melampygus]|nr:hypothetical protein INR49_012746 [Caranx melampygus]